VLSALALASVLYTVKPGDTLSGIAQHYNTTWEAIYDDNQSTIRSPNLVFAGQKIRVREGDPAASLVAGKASAPRSSAASGSAKSTRAQTYRVTPTAASTAARTTPVQSTRYAASPAPSGYDSGSLSDIPGVPASFAACVAYRESTDDRNPAAHGDAYGIIPASGYNVSGDSLAEQKQAFERIYDTSGPRAWAADGCNR
jgi:LysM repeat protein